MGKAKTWLEGLSRPAISIAPPENDLAIALTDREILRALIDDAAAEISLCFNDLPPSARASTLRLGHALSALRQRQIRIMTDLQKLRASAPPRE